MNDLRKAAHAVLDRWDGPKWDWLDAGPTADLMKDLRAALATVPSDCSYSHQPQRKPLTVAETNALINSVDGLGIGRHVMHKVARAIERAHGIGGKYER